MHYTTVRRGNVTEHISTTREAIEAIQKGLPAPNGTHFVLADYRDDKIYRYFVMEKGPSWGADFEERRRTGDWQFQWFWLSQRPDVVTRPLAVDSAVITTYLLRPDSDDLSEALERFIVRLREHSGH